ncbi:MAG: hypothetical protein LBV45_10335 [Xanthomonadaceae bacterium]|nr:hypothetical protein [Xanthomonadaceae bacterium]
MEKTMKPRFTVEKTDGKTRMIVIGRIARLQAENVTLSRSYPDVGMAYEYVLVAAAYIPKYRRSKTTCRPSYPRNRQARNAPNENPWKILMDIPEGYANNPPQNDINIVLIFGHCLTLGNCANNISPSDYTRRRISNEVRTNYLPRSSSRILRRTYTATTKAVPNMIARPMMVIQPTGSINSSRNIGCMVYLTWDVSIQRSVTIAPGID